MNDAGEETKARNREIARNESERQTVGDIRVSAWAVAVAVIIGLAALGTKNLRASEDEARLMGRRLTKEAIAEASAAAKERADGRPAPRLRQVQAGDGAPLHQASPRTGCRPGPKAR